MEITIGAGFFTEWNVDVDTGHGGKDKCNYTVLDAGIYFAIQILAFPHSGSFI